MNLDRSHWPPKRSAGGPPTSPRWAARASIPRSWSPPDQPGGQLRRGHPARPGGDRGLLLPAAADRGRDLRGPRPARPHARWSSAARKARMRGTLETCALPNLDYEVDTLPGPGRDRADHARRRRDAAVPPATRCRSARFSGSTTAIRHRATKAINVEVVRNRCGAALARRDDVQVDLVAGIPDSGTGHAIGYANGLGHPLWAAVREVHAHLAAQLHAAGPARPRPGRAHEAHPDPRADPRQAGAVLRGLDRPRHATPRHDPRALRLRRPGGPHAAGLPAAGATAASS